MWDTAGKAKGRLGSGAKRQNSQVVKSASSLVIFPVQPRKSSDSFCLPQRGLDAVPLDESQDLLSDLHWEFGPSSPKQQETSETQNRAGPLGPRNVVSAGLGLGCLLPCEAPSFEVSLTPLTAFATLHASLTRSNG